MNLQPLLQRWCENAADLRAWGCVGAATALERAADELEEYAREWESEGLTLLAAAQESGYSPDTLRRYLADGALPDARRETGKQPLIQRRHLPRKPGHRQARHDDGPDVAGEILEARGIVLP